MNQQILKSLLAVVLLAALAGCATKGAMHAPDMPTDTTGEAPG